MDIEIQFREEEGEIGVPIATVPFTKENIDSVIPLLKSWGMVKDYGDGDSSIGDSVYGQFRVLDNKVIFEVVNPA